MNPPIDLSTRRRSPDLPGRDKAPASPHPSRAESSGPVGATILDCQLALAKNDPHAADPDAGDFLRQQVARRDDETRVRVYGMCAKRAFREEQARIRALTTVRPDDDGPIAA